MQVPRFTTVVAVDAAHLGEFRLAHQTWKKCRPEIWENPLLIFADTALPPAGTGESAGWWERLLARTCDHPDLRVVGWPACGGATNRHRMLSALVYGTAEHVGTDWFVKIDTDTLCLPCENRWHPNWFDEKENFEFVTGSWGYSKGIERWRRLKEWAAGVPELAMMPEAPGEEFPPKDHVRHQRIISFFFVGRTRFMREVAALAPGPLLPIDSQDTVVWYIAHRLGRRYAGVRIKRFGFHHGARGMEKRVKTILATP